MIFFQIEISAQIETITSSKHKHLCNFIIFQTFSGQQNPNWISLKNAFSAVTKFDSPISFLRRINL